jgi:rod shape-determining protein MreD
MILQTSELINIVKFGGTKPDLVLVMVVWLGLVKGPDSGCISGFFFGLFEDAYSYVNLGSNALTKTIIGFFCGFSGRHLYTQSLFSHILCVAIGSVADKVILFSINGFTPEWKNQLIYGTLYNILCCPIVVSLFHFGERRLRPQRTSSLSL